MLKIMKERWAKNEHLLRDKLTNSDCNTWDYEKFVTTTFDVIWNTEEDYLCHKLNLNRMTRIDDGEYQGVLLFVVPFNTYQPCEWEYLMTAVSYGSCSGCDTLQNINAFHYQPNPTKEQVEQYMMLCKDLICNTVRPYNNGWREDEDFLPVED